MRRTMKSFVAIVILAFVSVGTASAQLGFQAGYVNSKFVDKNSKSDPFNGFNVGLTYDMEIQSGIGLHYGLLYTLISDKESIDLLGVTLTGKSSGHFLNIPVQATYKYSINNDLGIFAYGGPNFAVGIMGSNTLSSSATDEKLKDGWYKEGDGIFGLIDTSFDRFDIQLGVGLGIQYSNIILKGGYDWGLLNPYGDDNVKINRNQFNISVGYLF